MRKLTATLLVSACLIGPAMSQRLDIDLSKLPPDVAASVLKAEQERKDKSGMKMPASAEEAEKYAQIGEHVAKAVAATAKGLSMEVNDFVKTPVGWWVGIFVFWYFLGAKLWGIVGGILFWIVSNTMLWKAYKSMFIGRPVLTRTEGSTKIYENRSYKFESPDAKGGIGIALIVMFVAANIASLLIIF